MDIFKALLDNGLEHVAEQIYGLLEDPNVAQCRLVSRLWNSILQREWLVRKINHLCQKNDIITNELDYILKVSSYETLEEIVKVLKEPVYEKEFNIFGSVSVRLSKLPILIASSKGNVPVVEAFLDLPTD